jgi:hypothetical protein
MPLCKCRKNKKTMEPCPFQAKDGSDFCGIHKSCPNPKGSPRVAHPEPKSKSHKKCKDGEENHPLHPERCLKKCSADQERNMETMRCIKKKSQKKKRKSPKRKSPKRKEASPRLSLPVPAPVLVVDDEKNSYEYPPSPTYGLPFAVPRIYLNELPVSPGAYKTNQREYHFSANSETAESMDRRFLLSNLAKVFLRYDGLTYPSAEHAYQAQKFIPSDRIKFSTLGEFSKTSLFSISPLLVANKKRWLFRENIGIIARVVGNDEAIQRQFGLTKNPAFSPDNSYQNWAPILQEKFKQEPFLSILASTKEMNIMEQLQYPEEYNNEDEGKVNIWGASGSATISKQLFTRHPPYLWASDSTGTNLMRIRAWAKTLPYSPRRLELVTVDPFDIVMKVKKDDDTDYIRLDMANYQSSPSHHQRQHHRPRSPTYPPPSRHVARPRSPTYPPPSRHVARPRSPTYPPPSRHVARPRSPTYPPPSRHVARYEPRYEPGRKENRVHWKDRNEPRVAYSKPTVALVKPQETVAIVTQTVPTFIPQRNPVVIVAPNPKPEKPLLDPIAMAKAFMMRNKK